MVENLTSFHIGGIPGHRVEEHVFVIKSMLALAEKNNELIALQQYDYSKMFDRESLTDCLSEVYKSNVQEKLYKLTYKLNKNTRSKIKTADGEFNEKMQC